MKKFLVFVATIVGFSLVEALVDSALGITFPNIGAGVIHDILLITNGAVLVTVVRANIE